MRRSKHNILNFIRSDIYEPRLKDIMMQYYNTEYFVYRYDLTNQIYISPQEIHEQKFNDDNKIQDLLDLDIMMDNEYEHFLIGGPVEIPPAVTSSQMLYFLVPLQDMLIGGYVFDPYKFLNWLGPFTRDDINYIIKELEIKLGSTHVIKSAHFYMIGE